MRYVMLIYETRADFEARGPSVREPYVAAWRAYYRALVDAGVFVGGGAPLEEAGTATTIQLKDGRRHIQDGPFAETKEQLGGFMILDVASLDAALEWAARCPAAATGAVEVRPMAVAMHETITTP
jgi:hypothetical protein